MNDVRGVTMAYPPALIVEDEWLLADQLRDTMHGMGFAVVHCAHTLAAAQSSM